MTTVKPTWNDGPPPHIGWWNASVNLNYKVTWRWWDGVNWSIAVTSYTRNEVSTPARTTSRQSGVRWTDYWPENARVQRVAP